MKYEIKDKIKITLSQHSIFWGNYTMVKILILVRD